MRDILVAGASLSVGVLVGCASQNKTDFEAALAECRAEYAPRIGNYVPWARCTNAVSEQFSPVSDTAAPLIRATRLSLAEKVDRGEMTSAEAAAELQRVTFEARQEQARTQAANEASEAPDHLPDPGQLDVLRLGPEPTFVPLDAR